MVFLRWYLKLTAMLGGYGAGSSQEDLTYIIGENGNNFVGVAIQYRVSHGYSNIIMLSAHSCPSWVPSGSSLRMKYSGTVL